MSFQAIIWNKVSPPPPKLVSLTHAVFGRLLSHRWFAGHKRQDKYLIFVVVVVGVVVVCVYSFKVSNKTEEIFCLKDKWGNIPSQVQSSPTNNNGNTTSVENISCSLPCILKKLSNGIL